MSTYYLALSLHVVGATIWVGGHLTLVVTILPNALKQQRAATVSEFEQRLERIGIPALAVQIVTACLLAYHLLGSPDNWFDTSPVAALAHLR